MTKGTMDDPFSAPAFYSRVRMGNFRVGDCFLTHEAVGCVAEVKSIVEPGEWIVEAKGTYRDGRLLAAHLGLGEFLKVCGHSPSTGQPCDARTLKEAEFDPMTLKGQAFVGRSAEGEPIGGFHVTEVRLATHREPTYTLHGGKVPGWGTAEWQARCKEADESVDPTVAKAIGTGSPEDPLFAGLGLPDASSPNAPSLSTIVKRRRGVAHRRAFGHPQDPTKSFRPLSLDEELPGGGVLGSLLPSGESDPADVAVTAIEARNVRDALDAFARERPANAAAVERRLEGLSRREAARRHPPATARAVEKAEEKLDGMIARLRGRAG